MIRVHSERLVPFLLGVTLSVTTVEFADIQKLSDEDLRSRFRLPSSCRPALTALSTDPAISQVTVAVDCRDDPTAPSPRSGAARPAR